MGIRKSAEREVPRTRGCVAGGGPAGTGGTRGTELEDQVGRSKKRKRLGPQARKGKIQKKTWSTRKGFGAVKAERSTQKQQREKGYLSGRLNLSEHGGGACNGVERRTGNKEVLRTEDLCLLTVETGAMFMLENVGPGFLHPF